MKILILFTLLASIAFGQSQIIAGQLDVVDERFTWGSDSAIQLRYLVGQVHRDTSPSDTAKHWKRQDNTADSCSNPVYLGRTSKPVWKYALHEMAYARDPDSSTVVYRFEVRRKRLQYRGDTAWGPWVRAGRGVGYVDVTVQDTVAMPAIGYPAATWGARYGLFFLGDGTQARACPDVLPGTAGQANDTLILRNIRFIGR